MSEVRSEECDFDDRSEIVDAGRYVSLDTVLSRYLGCK